MANLAKAKDAKLWVFQVTLMTAKLPNSGFVAIPVRFSDFYFCLILY